MEQIETTSPPAHSNHDMPDGFQQLIDHNNNEAVSSYPPASQDQQQATLPTIYSHLNSTPHSGYSSPVSQYRQPEMSAYEVAQDESPYQYPPPENNYPPSYAVEQGSYQGSYQQPPEAVTAVSHRRACCQ